MSISNASVLVEGNSGGVSTDFPNFEVFTVGSGLLLQPGGPTGNLNLILTGALNTINTLSPAGILCVTTAAAGSTSAVLSTRTLTADASIAITNAGGVAGNILLAVNDNTSLQQVQILKSGSSTSPNILLPRTNLNFI